MFIDPEFKIQGHIFFPPNAVTNGLTWEGVSADFDCKVQFRQDFCDSGAFAIAAKPAICEEDFLNIPPFSCTETIPKYTFGDSLALAWSNAQMSWAACIACCVVVFRRLPFKLDDGDEDGTDGTSSREVTGEKPRTVV
jgi:hypothetical protein